MSITTDLKNIKIGEIPDGTIVKVWFWVKYGNKLNWAIYSEYKDYMESKSNE